MPKKFEGREVVSSSIQVTKAGDGLSASLEIEPTEIELDNTVYVILRTTVAKIHHQAIKPGSKQLDRKHTLVTVQARIVPETFVAGAFAEQDAMLEERRQEAEIRRVQAEDEGR